MDGNEETSLMDDLASAWDAAEGENDAPEQNELAEPPAGELSDEQPGADPDRGESAPVVSDGDEPGADREGLQVEGDAGADTAVETDKAPVGLPPEAREVWKDTPQAMRDAVAKREADFASGLQKYAENAKRAQQMDEALAPYQQLFALNGGNPSETIQGVLQTASVLQMGSPVQKAQMVANMIKQFGVDIKTLDRAIVGEAPPEDVQQQMQIDQVLNQRLAPLQQQLQQYQQRDQQQAQQAEQQVQSEVEAFSKDPKNEFYTDVREDMADILDMAANRRQSMSLKEAYDRACAMHPQIGKILRARESQREVQLKAEAATSIHGTPSGEGGGLPIDNLRATIEGAWDNAGRV